MWRRNALFHDMDDRRYGPLRRLYGLLRKPSETMEDIAASPDCIGPILIMAFYVATFSSYAYCVHRKFYITGPYAQILKNELAITLALSVILAALLFPIRWILKSLVVWKACDKGSSWDFRRALSITGYAYIADLVTSLATALMIATLAPTFHIDTSDLTEALRLLKEEYSAEIRVLERYGLAFRFGASVWKSYLGALGVYHGTEGRCPKPLGFAVFLALSLITVLMTAAGRLI